MYAVVVNAFDVAGGVTRSLLLIESGDRHEIRTTSRGLLRTVNSYVPPAYTASGDELPRARARPTTGKYRRGA